MALDRTRLLKPVEKLQKRIKKADRELTPSTVHELRTNVRRFEAIFKTLSLERHGVRGSTLKDLSRLDKRAGKVRDMDVLVRYASTVHPKTMRAKHVEESTVQLLEYLGNQRRKHARKLHAETHRLRGSLAKDLKRTVSVLGKLAGHTREHKAAAKATVTEARLKAELAASGRLRKDNLHAFRLKIKELRNVLEIERPANRGKLAKALGQTKDAIGEWHDWETLVTLAEKAIDREEGRGLIAELRRIAKNRYREAILLAEALRRTIRVKLRHGAVAATK